MEVDYTDYAYQSQLPMHARATAAKAVKNNLKLTEILADQNLITCSEKVNLHKAKKHTDRVVK